jgi:hypothetical protein
MESDHVSTTRMRMVMETLNGLRREARMTRVGSRVLVALPLVLLCGCGDSTGPGSTQTFEWSGQVDPGDVIEIRGINGSIQAVPASGSTTRIVATKRGENDDPATVRIDVVEHDGGATVCAVYPDVPGQPENECLPGGQGNLSSRDNDVSVTFNVEVPDFAELVAVTVNGNVTAQGMSEDVFGTTVNGNVDVTTAGIAVGTTVNGNIDVSIGQSDWDRNLSFVTVNGNVTVRIPSSTNAEVSGVTVNGSVSTDFPLTINNERTRMTGVLGSGGRLLALTTVNGSVALRER